MSFLFARAPMKVVRGTRWDDVVTLVDQDTQLPIDLTGITGLHMRVREEYTSEMLLDLGTDTNELLVTDAAGGEFRIQVPSAGTLAFPEADHEVATYVYDVIVERTPGEYEPAVNGPVIVFPQVTRPWGTT